jgi:DNA-binding transcriptional MerR regulator
MKLKKIRAAKSDPNKAFEHRLLIEKAQSLGISFAEIAEALGVVPHRLQNLYYARSHVPLTDQELTNLILLIDSKPPMETVEDFEKIKMSEVVQGWLADLELAPDDNERLSRLLGVAPFTVHRWRNDQSRPDLARYIVLSELVKLAALRLKTYKLG